MHNELHTLKVLVSAISELERIVKGLPVSRRVEAILQSRFEDSCQDVTTQLEYNPGVDILPYTTQITKYMYIYAYIIQYSIDKYICRDALQDNRILERPHSSILFERSSTRRRRFFRPWRLFRRRRFSLRRCILAALHYTKGAKAAIAQYRRSIKTLY